MAVKKGFKNTRYCTTHSVWMQTKAGEILHKQGKATKCNITIRRERLR